MKLAAPPGTARWMERASALTFSASEAAADKLEMSKRPSYICLFGVLNNNVFYFAGFSGHSS